MLVGLWRTDDELGERLGRNARRNYEGRFTLDRMIDETVAVYRELASMN